MNQPGSLPSLLVEPLADSAPLAWRWAAQHCVASTSGDACASYHGLWQYLRLMKLGAALGGHAPEYLRAMKELALVWENQGCGASRRLLISGCADYSMLAHVLHAFGGTPSLPAITVLDICPTPLKLNAWYAQKLGQPIETVCSDLLGHHPLDGYDLIVTSSFLGYFSPHARPRLFATYAAMLRPGGRLVFSNRLRPGPESVPTAFSEQQARRFADKVALSCKALPAQATLPEDAARQMALTYAGSRHPYPVNSADTIRRLAIDAGLRWIEGHHVASAPLQPGLSGPTLGDGSDFLFVTLER